MAKKNIPLLKRLRTRFLRMKHPQHFRMEQVAITTDCGAAMCMIGHTLDIAGYKMRLRKNGPECGGDNAARSDYDFIAPSGRRVKDPFTTAARLLGLTDVDGWREGEWIRGEAHTLFQDFNIKTPKQAAKRIARIIAEAEEANATTEGK